MSQQPTSQAEYEARAKENVRFEGRGITTTTIIPYPFCAAADFCPFPVTAALNNYACFDKPFTCKECGRSAKLNIDRIHDSVEMELVQTGGDDPPKWLVPKPRRV